MSASSNPSSSTSHPDPCLWPGKAVKDGPKHWDLPPSTLRPLFQGGTSLSQPSCMALCLSSRARPTHRPTLPPAYKSLQGQVDSAGISCPSRPSSSTAPPEVLGLSLFRVASRAPAHMPSTLRPCDPSYLGQCILHSTLSLQATQPCTLFAPGLGSFSQCHTARTPTLGLDPIRQHAMHMSPFTMPALHSDNTP